MRATLALCWLLAAAALPCDRDMFLDAQTGACRPYTTCSALEYESQAGTASTDRACAASCPEARYLRAPATPTTDVACAAVSPPCQGGQVEVQAPSATQDRVCASAAMCGPAAALVNPPIDAQLLACPALSMLTIENTAVTVIDLPRLTWIASTLQFLLNAALRRVDLAALGSAGSLTIISPQGSDGSNTVLEAISFGSLTAVHGDIQINVDNCCNTGDTKFNAALTLISLPQLTHLDGSLLLLAMGRPHARLSLPSLKHVGGCAVTDRTALTQMPLPRLTFVGGASNFLNQVVDVDGNPLVTSLAWPLLQSIGGRLSINNNDQLTLVSFPALTAVLGDITILLNVQLLTLLLPSLAVVRLSHVGVQICQNQLNLVVAANVIAAARGLPCYFSPLDCTSYELCGIRNHVGLLANVNATELNQYSLQYGNVSFISSASTIVLAPYLLGISGSLSIIDNANLTYVSFPALTFLGVDLVIRSAGSAANSSAVLSAVLFHALTFIAGDLNITTATGMIGHASAITIIALPALQSVASLFIQDQGAPALTITLAMLRTVHRYVCMAANGNAVLTIPNLQHIQGSTGNNDHALTIGSNALLTRLSFAMLSDVAGILIQDNSVLRIAQFPVLTLVHNSLVVQNNAALNDLFVPSIQSIPTAGAVISICGCGPLFDLDLAVIAAATNHAQCSVGYVCPTLATPCSLVEYSDDLLNPNLADVMQYNVIAGSLSYLSDASITQLLLPALQRLDGDVTLSNNPNLAVISMPALTRLAGLYVYAMPDSPLAHNSVLTSIRFDALQHVDMGLQLQLSDCCGDGSTRFFTALTLISFPRLTFIGLYLSLLGQGSPQPVLFLPQLAHVAGYVLVGRNTLTALALPQLSYIAGTTDFEGRVLNVDLSYSLQVLDLPRLTTIIGTAIVVNNSALTAVVLPVLEQVTGMLIVNSNPALTLLSAPRIGSIGMGLSICANAPSMQVPRSVQYAARGQACFIGNSCSSPITCASATRSFANADLDSLQYIAVLVGNIAYSSSPITSFTLPYLQLLDGSMTLAGNPDLAVISLPMLTYIGGNVAVLLYSGVSVPSDTATITLISFPALQRVVGELVINPVNCCNGAATYYATALTWMDFSALTSAASVFLLGQGGTAPTLLLPSLAVLSGYVALDRNTLTQLHVPSLAYVGGATSFLGQVLNVDYSQHITMLVFSALTTVGGRVSVDGNPQLATIAFPLLSVVRGIFQVNYGNALTYISVPRLTFVLFIVQVCQNPLLQLSAIPLNIGLAAAGQLCFFDAQCVTATACGVVTGSLVNAPIQDVLYYTSVTGALVFNRNSTLMSVVLPHLLSVGGDFNITGNVQLSIVQCAALTTVGGQLVVNSAVPNLNVSNTALVAVSLPALRSVHATLFIGYTSCCGYANEVLTHIDLAALTFVGAGFFIEGNFALTLMSLPQLYHVGPLLGMQAVLLLLNLHLTLVAMPAVAQVTGPVLVCFNGAQLVPPPTLIAAAHGNKCTTMSGGSCIAGTC